MASTFSTTATRPQNERGENRESAPSPTSAETLSTAVSIIEAHGQVTLRLKEIPYEPIPAHLLALLGFP